MIGRLGSQNIGDHQLGFSLLEVLIALLIATVVLFSLSSMQVSAIKGNGSSSERTRAIYLAQSTLENIQSGNMVNRRVFGFIDMSTANPGALLDSGALTGINERGEAGGPFDLQWQAATHTHWSRSITATVSWRSVSGINRHVQLTSITRGADNR